MNFINIQPITLSTK